jgi:hypothetical protein
MIVVASAIAAMCVIFVIEIGLIEIDALNGRTANFRFIAIPFQENFQQMHGMPYLTSWGEVVITVAQAGPFSSAGFSLRPRKNTAGITTLGSCVIAVFCSYQR